jgi:hypothetical protein
MSRQALSCAVLLLAVTLPIRAQDSGKPSPAASGGDSWAPLSHSAPASLPAPAPKKPKLAQTAPTGKGQVDHPPAGYHDVKLGGGAVIRVSDAPKAPVGEFGRTSSFSGRSFSAQASSLSQNLEAPELSQQPFATSSYGTSSYDNSDHTFQTASYRADARSSDDFSKAYTLPATQDSFAQSFTTKPSDLQDKSALIGQQPLKDPLATPWSEGDKKFYDPSLRKVKRDPYAGDSLDVSRLTNLPNRPLTIDEVRALINHEQIPNLDAKPEAPSRPLNDPNWEPPLKLPEISDKAAPATPPPDEAGAGELPSPGMMAQPDANGAVPPQK